MNSKFFWSFFFFLYGCALFIKIYQHNKYIHYLFQKQKLEYTLASLYNEKNKKQSELFSAQSDFTSFAEENFQRLTLRDIRFCGQEET